MIDMTNTGDTLTTELPKKVDANVSKLKVSIPNFDGTGSWKEADNVETDNKPTQQNVPTEDNKAIKKQEDKGNFRKGIDKLKSNLKEKTSENETIKEMYAALEKRNAELESLIKQPVERSNFNSDVEMIRHVNKLDSDHADVTNKRKELEQRFQANLNSSNELTYEQKIHENYETPDEIERFKRKMSENTTLVVAPHVVEFIMGSDVGPKIAEYLVDHQDELRDLNSLHPEVAKAELALIRRDVKKPIVRKESNAPGPIGSIHSTKSEGVDKNSLSFEEQLKLYRKQKASR